MVNGRSLKEELKRIDDFFDSLSAEEFEQIAFKAGLGEAEKDSEGVALDSDFTMNAICRSIRAYKNKPWMLDFFSRNVIINSIAGNLPPVYKTSR